MKKTFCTILLFISLYSYNQSQKSIANVFGSSIWLKTINENGKIILKDYSLSDNIFMDKYPTNKTLYLNNNISKQILESDIYSIPLSNKIKDNFTIFCVYKSQDTIYERNIWNISGSNTLLYQMSTFNFGDFVDNKYLDIKNKSRNRVQLSTYYQYKDTLKQNNRQLIFAQKSNISQLPIKNFKGQMPEIIYFDRVLSPIERARIESYLAIKYGITLDQKIKSNYYNSNSKIIWNSIDNGIYNSDIAGILIDENSYLKQTKSKSTNNNTVLEIEFADNNTINETYAFASSNGNQAIFEKKEQGMPAIMSKKWRLTGNNTEINMIFDKNEIQNIDKNIDVYAIIDKTGSSEKINYPYEFVKLNNLKLNNYTIDKDNSGADIIGLAQAPDMFFQAWYNKPQCGSDDGILYIKAEGGKAPYKCEVSINNELIKEFYIEDLNKIDTLNFISAGKYSVNIEDNNGKTYNSEFIIESANAPKVNLLNKYTLIGNDELTLNAKANTDEYCEYQWYKEDKLILNGEKINITSGGNYELRILMDKCIGRHFFEVEAQSDNNISSFDIFPNPTNDIFIVKVQFEREANNIMNIYDNQGKLIKTRQLEKELNQIITEKIDMPGIYYVTIFSEDDRESQKLIVVK